MSYTLLFTLFSSLLLTTIFSGCAQKNAPLACFKGSASCYTQQTVSTTNDCPTCQAVL